MSACRHTWFAPLASGGRIVPVATSAPYRPPAPDTDQDPRTVRAWQLYRDSLEGLSGADYESAEEHAWERLQRMLAEISRGAPVAPR